MGPSSTPLQCAWGANFSHLQGEPRRDLSKHKSHSPPKRGKLRPWFVWALAQCRTHCLSWNVHPGCRPQVHQRVRSKPSSLRCKLICQRENFVPWTTDTLKYHSESWWWKYEHLNQNSVFRVCGLPEASWICALEIPGGRMNWDWDSNLVGGSFGENWEEEKQMWSNQ